MNFWDRLSRKYFGDRSRSLEAQLALTQAYKRVFSGNPSRADQQVVLADLGAQCGWNSITSPTVASKVLWFNEGKRAMFELIKRHLDLSEQDVEALENAVKAETQSRTDFNLNFNHDAT